MSKLQMVPDGHNISVYFLLPLLGLNKFSLGGGDNFINSFLSYNGKIIIVVQNKDNIEHDYWDHPNYLTDFNIEVPNAMTTGIVYSIPEEFISDHAKFVAGEYSKFSEQAKKKIREVSGLPYKTPIPGSVKFNTHKLLLVLDKSSVLKSWLEKRLEIIIPEHDELLERPDIDQEYMDIDTIVI